MSRKSHITIDGERWPRQCGHYDNDGTRCPNDATSALENGYCEDHEDERDSENRKRYEAIYGAVSGPFPPNFD